MIIHVIVNNSLWKKDNSEDFSKDTNKIKKD